MNESFTIRQLHFFHTRHFPARYLPKITRFSFNVTATRSLILLIVESLYKVPTVVIKFSNIFHFTLSAVKKSGLRTFFLSVGISRARTLITISKWVCLWGGGGKGRKWNFWKSAPFLTLLVLPITYLYYDIEQIFEKSEIIFRMTHVKRGFRLSKISHFWFFTYRVPTYSNISWELIL